MTARETQVRAEPTRHADPAGNERLTAMTGAVLLGLFVAECLTLLNIGSLLTLHVFLGMLLLGPVSLKIGSTLWRFTRYYTGSAAYVRKGPPARRSGVARAAVGWQHGCAGSGRIGPRVPAGRGRVRRMPCGWM